MLQSGSESRVLCILRRCACDQRAKHFEIARDIIKPVHVIRIRMRRQVDVGGEEWLGRMDFIHEHLPVVAQVDSELHHSSLIDVESEQRAIEIAAKTSAAPGPGGRGVAKEIQVRPVMSRSAAPES